MYNAYFGFSESPFSLSPDPAFFYRSEQHEEALANLIYGVQSRKGFIVLTGEVGTGKTTMLECLRDFLDSQYIEFAFIFNSRITSDQFFEMIAYDLDLRCDRKSKTEVLFALNALLLNQADQGRTTVLIVDEAHNLVEDDPGVWQPETYDAIFCRNVIMYFTQEASKAVVARLTRALAPGGYLFLDAATAHHQTREENRESKRKLHVRGLPEVTTSEGVYTLSR